jgi:AraC-like DNA-binding protein
VRGVFARGYGLVLLACKDIRSVIAQSLRFESLDHDFGRTELVEDGGVAHLRIHSPWLDLPGGRHLIDCAASGILAQANWIAGQLLPAFGFATTFEAPAGVALDEYTRLLRAPVRFGAEFNEVSFPAILLDLPLPTSDAAALPSLERAAAKRLEARQRVKAPPIVIAVSDQIRATINRGAPRLSEIAVALGVAERTLQRKLAQSDATFAKLLDDVRRDIAEDLLQEDDVSLVDVAFQLGYSEQSAFNHAFRDWFGTSPSAWRKART